MLKPRGPNWKTTAPPQKQRRFHFLSSSSSSGNRGGPLRRKYQLPPRQATHRHFAIPTTSITSFLVRCRFLHRHNKLLRRGGNHYQQSSNDRTVGVPIQPQHEVSSSISTWRSVSGEDKYQFWARKAYKRQRTQRIQGEGRTKKKQGKKKAK